MAAKEPRLSLRARQGVASEADEAQDDELVALVPIVVGKFAQVPLGRAGGVEEHAVWRPKEGKCCLHARLEVGLICRRASAGNGAGEFGRQLLAGLARRDEAEPASPRSARARAAAAPSRDRRR